LHPGQVAGKLKRNRKLQPVIEFYAAAVASVDIFTELDESRGIQLPDGRDLIPEIHIEEIDAETYSFIMHPETTFDVVDLFGLHVIGFGAGQVGWI
jgi:hypothetical protein